jgi:hypothetical protein
LHGDHLSDRERGWLHKDGKARSAGGACWRYLHDTAAIALRGVGAGHGVSLGGCHAGRGRLVDLVPVAFGRLQGGGACARSRRDIGVILHGLEGEHFAIYRVINQCANHVGCGVAPYVAGGYLVGADTYRVGFRGALIFLGVVGVCEIAPRDDVSFSVRNQGASGQIRCGRVEVTDRYNSDVLRITTYIAWSLQSTEYKGPSVDRAIEFVEKHMDGATDAYTLAVIANLAADYGRDREFTQHAVQQLLDARTEKVEQVWWTTDETGVYGTGASAAVETTGLAAQALLRSGESSGVARKALTYLVSKKDGSGTWGTTQATIVALRALLTATEKGAADVRGTVTVALNGKPAETLALSSENDDLYHQFVFKAVELGKTNTVEIRFDGKGGLTYQVVGGYFLPWDQKAAVEPLSIDVSYDRTSLFQADVATVTATVRNNLDEAAKMVILDLGIPPGFELFSEDLQEYQDKSARLKSGHLSKFSITATQAILYFDSFAPGDTVKVKYRLQAKYPIRAKTLKSRVYEYYAPEVSSVAPPVQLEVHGR